jgi:chromosome segregation ATPase
LLGTIQDKASRPIDTKAGFSGLSKDVGNAEVMFNTLIRTLHELKNASDDVKLELLTDADKAKLTAGLAELEKYKKALEAIIKTEKDLANAEKADKKAQKEVAKNSEAVKRTKGKISSKSSEKKEVEAKIAKLSAEPEKNAE